MTNKALSILHVSGVKKRGGGENHLLNLSKGLQENGVHTITIAPRDAQILKEFERCGLEYQPARLKFKMDPLFVWEIIRICKKRKVSIVHAHDPIAMFLVIMASYFYMVPTAVYSKKTSFPIKNRRKTLYKYNHPVFKKVICVSKEVERVAQQSLKNPLKTTTIYNGSNLNLLKQLTSSFDLREKLDLDPKTFVILHIANHTKPKDLPTLMRVVERFKNDISVHFVQIGRHTSHTIPILETQKNRGLEDRITFLGEVHQASAYLKQADVSLITSKSEGLPQVIYESMFYKVPIVSTKAGGIPEVIEDKQNGFLCDIGDDGHLERRIREVLNSRLHEMLEISYSKVKSQYDSNFMVSNTIRLYKSLL